LDKYANWQRSELLCEIENFRKLIKKRSDENIRFQKIIKERDDEITLLRAEVALLRKKNNRGAGRKSKLTDALCAEIKKMRTDGMTFQAIADKVGLSISVVHKATTRGIE